MAKIMNKFTAILTAGFTAFSSVGVYAADIEAYHNTNIEASQEENMPAEDYGIEEGAGNPKDMPVKPYNQPDGKSFDDHGGAEEERRIDTEPKEKGEDEQTEGGGEKSESANVSVDIDNSNNVYVENNTGTININIYNNIGVNIDTDGSGEESDVDIITYNQIQISRDETAEETSEETTEAITEATTEASVKITASSGKSSSKRTSSSSGGKSVYLNTANKAEAQEDEAEYTETEKKVVCMTIGSDLLNIDGESTKTDSAPYISESCTLVPPEMYFNGFRRRSGMGQRNKDG